MYYEPDDADLMLPPAPRKYPRHKHQFRQCHWTRRDGQIRRMGWRRRREFEASLEDTSPKKDEIHSLPGIEGSLASQWIKEDRDKPLAEGCCPIVMDVGSGTTKVGYAGQNLPQTVFPSVVGRPKGCGIMVGMDARDFYVGVEAVLRRGVVRLKCPIERGHVINWNDFERVIKDTFIRFLKANPEEHPLVMCHVPGKPSSIPKGKSAWYHEEKRAEIIFESCHLPAFFCCNALQMTLFASGLTSGTVVHSGHGASRVLSFDEESAAIRTTFRRLNIGGGDMIEYLVKLQKERGLDMTTSLDMIMLRWFTERHCHVSVNFDDAMAASEERCSRGFEGTKQYELPDGTSLCASSECFRVPEILFKPSLIGSELIGLSNTLRIRMQNAHKLNPGANTHLIAVGGGVTTCPGFDQRLEYDISGATVVPTSPQLRKHSTWIGASVVTSLASFDANWIGSDMYDEYGGLGVVRRFMTPRKKWPEQFDGIKQLIVPFDTDEGLDERIVFLLGMAKDGLICMSSVKVGVEMRLSCTTWCRV